MLDGCWTESLLNLLSLFAEKPLRGPPNAGVRSTYRTNDKEDDKRNQCEHRKEAIRGYVVSGSDGNHDQKEIEERSWEPKSPEPAHFRSTFDYWISLADEPTRVP